MEFTATADWEVRVTLDWVTTEAQAWLAMLAMPGPTEATPTPPCPASLSTAAMLDTPGT